jgi:hypothetical protein
MPQWNQTNHSVNLGCAKVTYKFAFVRGVGVTMPKFWNQQPIYEEWDLQTIRDGGADWQDELTKTQMKKLQDVFVHTGDWMHAKARVCLGKMCVGLGTFTFLERIPGMGAAIFQGPMVNSKSKWFQKQVVIRAFVTTEPPTFIANISGDRTTIEDEGIGLSAKPGVKVSIAGALTGAMPWSKKYVDQTGLEIKVPMKEYLSFFNRSRKANDEAPIGVSFIMDHKEVGDSYRFRWIKELWPPSSPSEVPSEPAVKKPRHTDDKR